MVLQKLIMVTFVNGLLQKEQNGQKIMWIRDVINVI